MTIDQLREYIVVVNNGSGCVVQPASDEYSYVLTAKHNIIGVGKVKIISRFKLENNNWKEIEIPFGELIENENYFPHPHQDIAILRVGKIDGLNKMIRISKQEKNNDNFILAGYPDTRRKANPDNRADWFRQDVKVILLNTLSNGLREAQVPGNPGIDEIIGHSGGSLLRIEGEFLQIAGIQNQMAKAINEQLGRIAFTPIAYFDEIVRERANLLPILQQKKINLSLPPVPSTAEVRKFITEEIPDGLLTDFCHDHFPTVFNNFSSGMNKGQKALQLIDYCIRKVEMDKLIDLLRQIE